ncbi:sensor histidine kinase [Arcobacter roscoffensis]|uniref:histidine kinase n=1 Tax=Arcobacter roscoffensis TaxID=2961520 RepID=A0ABY5E7S5_9BACT|nr:ATP-binding protein [Arcobacter roscoffensis]UTJ07213.1 ATP-binding protein [Arcobacter roscoffensis]
MKLITLLIYLLLTISWIYILYFSIKEIAKGKLSSKSLFTVLFLILIIDSIRTIIESLYFGTRLASQYGVLPKDIFLILSNPNYLFIPKLINAIAAISIIFLIIRRWYPNKINEEDKLKEKYLEEKKTKEELERLNKNLDLLVKEKTKELEELNKNLENRVKEEIEKNKQNEQRLFNQSKMAAMGEMIKNIAHQWRQPLSSISTLSSGTKFQLELGKVDEKDIKENLQHITNTAKHMSKTIDDFQNFFKPSKQATTFTMQELIDASLKITAPMLKLEHIELDIINESNCNIKGPINEYTQVMINLITNAKDALSHSEVENKKIKLHTKKINNTCTINISDNAGGIREDIIDRVFEPYFTTKHKSQGTGLGLYMSKEIIEKHLNGSIEVKNNKEGAVFTIIIPSKTCYI